MLLRCCRSIAHWSEIRISGRTLSRVNHCAAWCASASSWAFGVKSHPLASLWSITLHELMRSSSTSSCIMRLLAHHLIAARAATTVPTAIEIDASSAQSTLALKLTRASRRLPILNVLLHIAVAIIVLVAVVVVVVLRLLRLLIGEHASSSIESPTPVVPSRVHNILLLHLRLQ